MPGWHNHTRQYIEPLVKWGMLPSRDSASSTSRGNPSWRACGSSQSQTSAAFKLECPNNVTPASVPDDLLREPRHLARQYHSLLHGSTQ